MNHITTSPVFSMNFRQQCEHFEENHSRNPQRTGKIIGAWVWDDTLTIRQVLQRWINNNGLPFLDELQRLWFCVDGKSWVTYDYEAEGDVITYYEMK